MSDDGVHYPTDAGATAFLLTVRGTSANGSIQEARKVHNATAGAPAGVAAARALSDLSHNVYVGRGEAQQDQILFLDYWNSLTGLGRFFADDQVKAGADQLFSARDAVVWAPLAGYGDVHLAVPAGRGVSAVGLLRAAVTSLDEAGPVFSAYTAATFNRARSYGLVGHTTWMRAPDPGQAPGTEIISMDLWQEPDGMEHYYALALGFDVLAPAFTAPPETSAWETAPGEWVEW
jgi:hypothetical protein